MAQDEDLARMLEEGRVVSESVRQEAAAALGVDPDEIAYMSFQALLQRWEVLAPAVASGALPTDEARLMLCAERGEAWARRMAEDAGILNPAREGLFEFLSDIESHVVAAWRQGIS